MLLQVLQEDCGVEYNPQRIYDVDFTNSKDLFIHGMIDDQNGGTCASMPVLYVAVGRRLGYPLFLSHTKGHLFVRWEDAKERFNIDGSGEGFSSHPDEFYLTWPLPLTETEKAWNYFLTTKTPAQELATFLATRAHCLLDTGHADEAKQIYLVANKLDTHNPFYALWAAQIAAQKQ
jgi:regulator of sirC expression with transglutaminase-like and TPR domain